MIGLSLSNNHEEPMFKYIAIALLFVFGNAQAAPPQKAKPAVESAIIGGFVGAYAAPVVLYKSVVIPTMVPATAAYLASVNLPASYIGTGFLMAGSTTGVTIAGLVVGGVVIGAAAGYGLYKGVEWVRSR